MSLRNRARSLQKKTGLTYQQALVKLRELGARPAKLARESGWPLEVCDRYLVDGHAPIAVVEVKPIPSLREELQRLCDELRESCNARVVALHRDGRMLVGSRDKDPPVSELAIFASLRSAQSARMDLEPPEVMELDGGYVIHSTLVRRGVILSVRFHRDESSLGLVRLRVRRAKEELAALLSDEPRSLPPVGGAGGTGGVPNELRVVAPVAEERPKRRPVPIGKRRKR